MTGSGNYHKLRFRSTSVNSPRHTARSGSSDGVLSLHCLYYLLGSSPGEPLHEFGRHKSSPFPVVVTAPFSFVVPLTIHAGGLDRRPKPSSLYKLRDGQGEMHSTFRNFVGRMQPVPALPKLPSRALGILIPFRCRRLKKNCMMQIPVMARKTRQRKKSYVVELSAIPSASIWSM